VSNVAIQRVAAPRAPATNAPIERIGRSALRR
jgi:hypothetical protein